MMIGCKRVWGPRAFVFVKMTFFASLDSMDAVMKQCGLEVPCRMTFGALDIPKK
jgi:hypothetical protein